MSENINDSNDEVLAVEETVETETVAVAEEVSEAPVAEEPVEAPVIEEKPVKAKKAPKPVVEVETEKVALFSERNINWAGVGSLKAGYNIVSKADADLWLSGSLKVREATPEEITRVNN